MDDGKIVITGAGRAGTTFLMKILTRVGCDTGFTPYNEPYEEDTRSGCEWVYRISSHQSDKEIRKTIAKSPYIIKAPDLSRGMKFLLLSDLMEIEHVYMPVRDVAESADSRLNVGLDWMINRDLDYEMRLEQQILVNYAAIGQVVEACLLYQIPLTVMNFHIFTVDEEYCYQKLSQGIKNIGRKQFGKVYQELLSERKNKKNGKEKQEK